MAIAGEIIEVLKGMRRSDSEFPVRVAAEAALNKFYSAWQRASFSDDAQPIALEESPGKE